MKAWRVHRYGSPSEALELDELEVTNPGPGEVRVQVASTVLNWNDIDGCRGRYETVKPELPYVLGMEVVGRVDAAGEGGEDWIGQRVNGNWLLKSLKKATHLRRDGSPP